MDRLGVRAAVQIVKVPGGHHVGIRHDSEAGDSYFLHLAWHHRLRNELCAPGDEARREISPKIHPLRLVQVAAYCRKIFRANEGGIPYAFSGPNDVFDDSNYCFVVGHGLTGLTCSHFVLAVFCVSGIQLVDQSTWPLNRSGDLEWQTSVVASLEANGASREHIDAVKDEIGSARYRPSEVAAASGLEPQPVPFMIAEKAGKDLEMDLDRSAGDAEGESWGSTEPGQ